MSFNTSKYILFNLILIISLFFTNNAKAQEIPDAPKSDFWNHVRFGGGLGLSTTNDFFTLGVSPSAIYDFNEQFSLGTALNYTYNKFKNRYKSNIYGGSIIGLFNPINEIQVSAEFEELYVNRKYEGFLDGIEDDSYFSPALFLGAGYRTNNVTLGLRYNLLFDDNKSVYANAVVPFVRVYF